MLPPSVTPLRLFPCSSAMGWGPSERRPPPPQSKLLPQQCLDVLEPAVSEPFYTSLQMCLTQPEELHPCERCGPNPGVTWAGPVLLWSRSAKVCRSPSRCGGHINRGWHATAPAQVLSSSWGKSQKPELLWVILQERPDCTSSRYKTPFLNCDSPPHLAQIHVLGALLWPLVAACAGRAGSDPSGRSAGLSLPGSGALGRLLCPLYPGQAAEGLGQAQSSEAGLGAPLAT